MRDFILSVDQSTSATKAVLFDKTGRLVHRASAGHQQFYPQPDSPGDPALPFPDFSL